ncbi:ferric iron reductase [Bacillus toyonensis]|uniref:ferric iron reductase n=1 Tax=Bacillus toyonensis TaxID=155322 RepID=UPI003F64EB95
MCVIVQPFLELKGISSELKKVLHSEPPEGLTQFIFTGLFICHFRYLSCILQEYKQFSEQRFWSIICEEILSYQKRFPHLEERFKLFDLLKPMFTKLTLNRNRMFDYGMRIVTIVHMQVSVVKFQTHFIK